MKQTQSCVFVAAGLWAITLWACGGHGHGHGHGHTENNAPHGEKNTPRTINLTPDQISTNGILTLSVRRGHLTGEIRAFGEFAPLSGASAEIITPAKGTLLPLGRAITTGMSVTQGEQLAIISPYVPSESMGQLLAAYQASHIVWQNRKRMLKRVEKLVAAHVESRARLTDAQAAVAVAQSNVNSQWEQIARVRRSQRGESDPRSLRTLRSPLSGRVMEAHYVPGSVLSEGKLLYRVVNLDRLALRVDVFHDDFHRLRKPVTGSFQTPGGHKSHTLPTPAGQEPLLSRVHHHKRTVEILFHMNNAKREYHVGQRVTVLLDHISPKSYLLVPRDAVIQDGFFQVLFVELGPGRYERRVVTTGESDEGYVAILSGVREGERVVSANPMRIQYINTSIQLPQSAHTH